MYNVSKEFSKAIKNNARFIQSYFVHNSIKYDIRSLNIDDNVYANDNFVGTFIAKSGSITTNKSDGLKLENENIDIFIGIKLENEDIEYVPMGRYKIYEVTSINEFKIIDTKYKFNTKFDTSKIVYPTTPLLILKEACKQAETECLTIDFNNKDLAIKNEVFFGYDATCSDVVTAVAQASCTFAKINRENKLELKWFSNVDFSIELSHQKKKPSVNDKFGAINSVVLAREPQNDNVFWPTEIEGERIEFKISNNPLLDIDRYISILPIYECMNGFEYFPFSTESQGYFHLDCGDIVKLQKEDMSYTEVYIMNHSIKYSGGVSSTFETPALTKTQINYSIASSIESKIHNTELQVDKVNKRITAEISEVNTKINNIPIPQVSPFPPENPIEGQLWVDITTDPPQEKIYSDGAWVTVGDYTGLLDGLTGQIESLNTSLTLEQGRIETLIKENITIINGNEVTLKEAYSYIQQEIDAINFAISESGGNNKLLNSCGWNGLKYWDIKDDVVSLSNVEIRNSTISGYAFLLNKGSLEQSFKTIAGRKYSISCKIKKFTNACTFIIKNGTSEDVLFNLNEEYKNGWISFSMPIEAKDTFCTIHIESADEYLYVSDIMVNDGEISQQWSSSNDEIYTMNVKIDREGIEISQSDTNNRTVINTEEFAGYEGTKKVFSVNGDVTSVNRLKADSDVQIGVVRMYARTTGSKKGLGFAYIKGGSL